MKKFCNKARAHEKISRMRLVNGSKKVVDDPIPWNLLVASVTGEHEPAKPAHHIPPIFRKFWTVRTINGLEKSVQNLAKPFEIIETKIYLLKKLKFARMSQKHCWEPRQKPRGRSENSCNRLFPEMTVLVNLRKLRQTKAPQGESLLTLCPETGFLWKK